MDGSLKLTALATAVRLAIGLVFLRSALAKVRHPLAFVQAVQGYATRDRLGCSAGASGDRSSGFSKGA